MQLAYRRPSLAFELHIRCENCARESVRVLEVPDVDDAPQDVEDLAESGLLSGIRYCCAKCEGLIGRLFAVMPLQGRG
ncbi:MAG: hypothetical protein H2043_06565 [Rhizobiales bacterium]|nr:hypothetical protein [Hyphomicrobiales bacterium]